MSVPLHINYYVVPKAEAKRRIDNIVSYYFMQGVRAVIRSQQIDNDDKNMLLITYIFNVYVDDGRVQAMFTETTLN